MDPIESPRGIGTRPWRIVGASIVGLIVAIVVAGTVAFFENERVKDVTEGAILFDLEIEDEGDDLRVAVLDVRHHHRNILFNGPSDEAVAAFEQAYRDLHEEIDELAAVPTIVDYSVPQPAEIRALAERYYTDFSPAIALYDTDRQAFLLASDQGLEQISQLDDAADRIDDLGEALTEGSLTRVHEATTTERFILAAILGGVLLVGVVLAISAGRVFARMQASFAREQATAQELAHALRTKTNFIADASHELRTPLTVLRGNAETGLALKPDCVHREFLEEIVEESAWMTRLVEDLLFLARSDAAAPPLKIAQIPVESLLDAVAARADVLAGQSGVVLSTALTAEGTVVADAARIEQAVLALVDNAAKFSPPGGTVGLSSSTSMGELVVEVADQGPGIPEAELTRIFERFYRIDKARNRQRGGAGLGLSIAQTIVEAHRGRIEAQSVLGQGTRMRIHLPLAGAASPALPESMANAVPELAGARASS